VVCSVFLEKSSGFFNQKMGFKFFLSSVNYNNFPNFGGEFLNIYLKKLKEKPWLCDEKNS